MFDDVDQPVMKKTLHVVPSPRWKQFLPPDARPYGCCNPRILAAVGCEEKFWADFLQMSCLYHVEQYHQLRGEGGWAFHERAVEIAQAQGPHFFTGRMKCWRGYMAAALIANGAIKDTNEC